MTVDRFTGERSAPATVDRTEILQFPGGGSLWVGGQDSGWHFPGYVIDLRSEEEAPSYGATRWPVFQMLRNGGWRADRFRATNAVEYIDRLIREGKNVLVRCGSGIERSPAIVVLYLVRKQGMGLTEAYRLVRDKRPQVLEEPDILPLTYGERTR